MKCNYLKAQFDCPNYKDDNKAGFKLHKIARGRVIENHIVTENSLIFVIEGRMLLSYNENHEKILNPGEMLFIPRATNLKLTISEDVKVIRCWFDIQTMLCNYFRLDMLEPYIDHSQSSFFTLNQNSCIKMYLGLIEKYIEKEFICSCLYKNKQEELFHLLRAFYGKRELANLFAPIIGKDAYFINAVMTHYNSVHNVAELADKTNYSLSGFRKKFELCFGQSAFTWLQHKRSDLILKDIIGGIMSNKEIIDKYDFSSDARFYEFCKRIYGKTPGQIRKTGAINNNQ